MNDVFGEENCIVVSVLWKAQSAAECSTQCLEMHEYIRSSSKS